MRYPDDPRTEDYPLMGEDLKRGGWYMDESEALIVGTEHLKTPYGTLVAVDAVESVGSPIYAHEGPFRTTNRRPWDARESAEAKGAA